MKILFISNIFSPHVRGGYELGCLELAEKYKELGHSVIVASSENIVSLRKYPDPNHIDVRRIFNPVRYYEDAYDYHLQSNTIYCYDKIMAFGGYIESNCIALRRLIESENPDLIWIFNPLGIGPIGILDTVVSCNTKSVIHLMEHVDNVIQNHSGLVDLTGKWQYLKTKMTAISCSQKICNSNNTRGKYKVNKIVYNWINFKSKVMAETALLHDKINDSPCLKIEKINSGVKPFKLVYFGQIAEKKGITFLYELAKKIFKSSYKNKVIIDIYGKGEPEFMNLLEQKINADGLSETLVLKGFMSKESLLKKLPDYDLAIFLLSDDEPFAYAPIEAILKGIPLIITSKSGNSEILEDKHNAILLKNRKDISTIYQEVIWCLNNPLKLEAIAKNALATIKEKCDLDDVTIPVLNEVIDMLPVNPGYSFDYVLSVCETLRYPYFDLNVNTNLKGVRYKFIDKVIKYAYNFPVIGKLLQNQVNVAIQIFKKIR